MGIKSKPKKNRYAKDLFTKSITREKVKKGKGSYSRKNSKV